MTKVILSGVPCATEETFPRETTTYSVEDRDDKFKWVDEGVSRGYTGSEKGPPVAGATLLCNVGKKAPEPLEVEGSCDGVFNGSGAQTADLLEEENTTEKTLPRSQKKDYTINRTIKKQVKGGQGHGPGV